MVGWGSDSSRRGRYTRGAIVIGGALLAFLLSGAPAWAAPFANGSFETPAINTDYVTRVAPYNFGDWRVAAGSVDHKNTYWQAASGSRSIDLNGGDPGRLCQTFDTPMQGPARVGFMMSHNPDDGNLNGTLRVRVNGTLVGAPFVHNAANSLANMMWQPRSVTFNVATPTITLCLQSVTPGAHGPAIDAVTFTSLNYGGEIEGDGPLVWYRLGENSAAPLLDSAPPPQDGTCVNGVTFGLPGALADGTNTARGFDGRAAYCYASAPSCRPGSRGCSSSPSTRRRGHLVMEEVGRDGDPGCTRRAQSRRAQALGLLVVLDAGAVILSHFDLLDVARTDTHRGAAANARVILAPVKLPLQLALAALLVAAAVLAPSAAATPAADLSAMIRDHARDDKLTPCRFTKNQLNDARTQISRRHRHLRQGHPHRDQPRAQALERRQVQGQARRREAADRRRSGARARPARSTSRSATSPARPSTCATTRCATAPTTS